MRRFVHLLTTMVIMLLPVLVWGHPQHIRVVMDDNYPPFVFKTPEGALQGILIDQWRLWEQKTGVRVELQAMDWAVAQKQMDAGVFDVIDTIFKTEARIKKYDFTKPYQRIDQPIYFNREISGIKDASSLKGFTVAVKEGGAVIDFLKQRGIDNLVFYPSYEAIVRAAKEGKVSVFSADQPPAAYFLHKMGITDRFNRTEPLSSGEFHRAVHKGDHETLRLVEEGFADITPAELKKIEDTWYGSAVQASGPGYNWLLWVTVVTGLALLLLLAWNWGLRKLIARRTTELCQNEERFRTLIDLAVDTILQGDQAGTIVGANQQAEILTGYSRHELLGMNISRLFSKEERLRKPLRYDLLKQGETVRNERQLQRKDGSQVAVEMNTKMMPDGTYQAFIRDYSARVQIENDLVQARQAAEMANEAKSLFLANMSHEIRTPLNAIIGINSLLAERIEPGELRELAKDSMAAANNLLDIISDVLDISKIEAGKLEIMAVPFDPRMLANQLERMFGAMVREKGLRFEVSLSAGLPGQLISDPARIQQIGVNLLSNALKFTQQGVIRLRLSGSEPLNDCVSLELRVSDSGKGILPQHIERVFKPFEQEDLSTTRKYGGTGLGLAISRHLVEMLGGTISVESRVGEGSTFICTIPCKVAVKEADTVMSCSSDTRRETSRRLRILVAEDSVINCKMMEAILRMEGHRVAFADNGRKAVELWQQEPFDLILMDIQMPEMDGMEATNIIRATEAAHGRNPIPIIALTAYAMSGDKQRFLQAGMDAYLPKPITAEQLRRLLWEYGGEAQSPLSPDSPPAAA